MNAETEILNQRAEIVRAIDGQTICGLLQLAAEQAADQPALSDVAAPPGAPARADSGAAAAAAAQAGPDTTLTWSQARDRVLRLAAGFDALGLAPGERVALMLPNRTEHWLADQAAVHAAAVPVTFYATLAPGQIAFMARDCDARIVILDGERELERWLPVLSSLPGLKKVIVRGAHPGGEPFLGWDDFAELGERRFTADPVAVTGRIASVVPEDPVTVLYTSGTTGRPKGVIITHRNVMYEMASVTVARGGTIGPGGVPRPAEEGEAGQPETGRWVSYLPLAHIAERMYSIYLAIGAAGHVYFCPDAAALAAARTVVRPTGFFGVPRVWEKMRAAVRAGLTGLAEQDPARRAAVEQAMAVGRRYVRGIQFGGSVPDGLEEEFRRADEQVLRPVRALIGLGEMNSATSAAAPLPADVADFFAGLGLPILDVYGMTETTGAFTVNTQDCFKLGTVGRPLPGVEARIAGDGEILTRSPLNTPGYLNLPEATAALIDAEGWLHTGDLGSLDGDGFLSVTGRKKEMIITAGGENIAPAAVEALLTEHPLIGQALCYGDGRPYVVALLTLDGEAARAWAAARGLGGKDGAPAASMAELAADPAIQAAAGEAVAAANARLARVQQVKRWRLLPGEWRPETGELTPTLKLRRPVIHDGYAGLLAELYAEGG